jgi:hypothetical protein
MASLSTTGKLVSVCVCPIVVVMADTCCWRGTAAPPRLQDDGEVINEASAAFEGRRWRCWWVPEVAMVVICKEIAVVRRWAKKTCGENSGGRRF